MSRLFSQEPFVIVSRLGAVEMHSVLAGKVRTEVPTEMDAALARRGFRADVRRKHIRVVVRHYDLAASLIEKYGNNTGLRTLDSLAVGLDLAQSGLAGSFVTADKVLARIAVLEALATVDPETTTP